MKIVLIGAGNVATVLGKLFYQHGLQIAQVVGRSKASTELLATELHAAAVLSLEEIDTDADLYLIAVPDSAVPAIAAQLRLKDKLVVHTAGTLALNTITSISDNIGVIWPLQSLRKEIAEIPVIPFVIDGNTTVAIDQLSLLLRGITNQVYTLGDEERKKLHLSAVLASNFTNHLYALTHDYCNRHALPFDTLQPLIAETANRLNKYPAKDIQTGPSVRGDKNTVEAHLHLLEQEPTLIKLYQLFDESISKLYSDK